MKSHLQQRLVRQARRNTLDEEKIIPNGIWVYFKRAFTFGQVARAHPFLWAVEESQPELRKGVLNYVWCSVNIITIYAYAVFVVVRCVQTHLDPVETIGRRIYMKFALVYYVFPAMYQTYALLKRKALLQVTTHNIWFMEWIEENLRMRAKKLMRTSIFLMAYIFYGFVNISIMVAIYAFLAPWSPEMLSSVLTEPNILTRIACGLFQGYVEYIFHSLCFLILFNILISLFPSWLVLMEIRTWITQDLETSADKFLNAYNAVQILTDMTSDVFFALVYPVAEWMGVGLVIFCTYSAVRLDGFIALMLGTLGLTLASILVFFVSNFAQVFEMTVGLKQKLQSLGFYRSRKTLLGKRVRALRPIRIWMMSSYYADKLHVLTLIDTIATTSISFLLGNPAK